MQKTNAEVVTGKVESDNDAQASGDVFHRCRLLVSASEVEEWELAMEVCVDWIDLKDPRSGPLGRPDFQRAEEFAQRMARGPDRRWSIAGGEWRDWSLKRDRPFLSLLGGTGCVKWALAGCAGEDAWRQTLPRAVAQLPAASQAILVHYADHQECDAPAWESVLEVGHRLGLRYLLIDTAIKDGRGLLDHLSVESLSCYVHQARAFGMEVAIAGALRLEQLPLGDRVGASWVGVRGAVCSQTDRVSPFCREKLQRAVALLRGPAVPEFRRESSHVLG